MIRPLPFLRGARDCAASVSRFSPWARRAPRARSADPSRPVAARRASLPAGWLGWLGLLLTLPPALPASPMAGVVPVEIVETRGGFQLLRGGRPYFIRGAGGDGDLALLARCGANSLRTWEAPPTELLDRAQALGLSVCVGLWVQHERHGYDYSDPAAFAAEVARHCAAIDRLRQHPAVLLWAIGNEVELQSRNPRVWDAVEAVAAHARRVDPHHPTATVIAHAPPAVVAEIRRRCPSLDLLGSNSYAALGQLSADLLQAGWDRPYFVAEWGPDGSWEAPRTAWGAEIEPSSTEKALRRALRYATLAGDRERCLGGYAFFWGSKQETTATWFNIFLPDGSPTESRDILQYLWSGRGPATPAPRVALLTLNRQSPEDSLRVAPEAPLEASFALTRGAREQVAVTWRLFRESDDKRLGGEDEQRPAEVPLADCQTAGTSLRARAPVAPGPYRLFLFVKAPDGSAATANFPFLVQSSAP